MQGDDIQGLSDHSDDDDVTAVTVTVASANEVFIFNCCDCDIEAMDSVDIGYFLSISVKACTNGATANKVLNKFNDDSETVRLRERP